MKRRVLTALAAAALIFAGPAQAACEWSDRISMDSAECLTGGWNNQTWPKKDTAWVQNECPNLGTVVAKIDRKDAADWTPRLEDGARVDRYGTAGNIRGIHCCSDLSDLCNKSDIVTDENCVEAFRTSEADRGTAEGEPYPDNIRSCFGATATADPANESCTIETDCGWWDPTFGNRRTGSFVITVPYVDAHRVVLTRDGLLGVQ